MTSTDSYCQTYYASCTSCTADPYCKWCGGSGLCRALSGVSCSGTAYINPSDCNNYYYDDPYYSSSSSTSGGTIAGAIIGSIGFVLVVTFFIFCMRRRYYRSAVMVNPTPQVQVLQAQPALALAAPMQPYGYTQHMAAQPVAGQYAQPGYAQPNYVPQQQMGYYGAQQQPAGYAPGYGQPPQQYAQQPPPQYEGRSAAAAY
jgi:hypothetical protein